MCGLLTEFGNELSDERKFEDSLALMHHRGPDSFGLQRCGYYQLGHRRLKIIDLSEKSGQPMKSKDLRWSIVFNGEIYNYLELRSDLEASYGIEFKSKGDTEVLLEGIAVEGIDFIKKCNGMFAIALIDNNLKELFLVRDRMGIKPLYYAVQGKKVLAASEQKSILKLLDSKPTLDKKALVEYFSFRYPVGRETFFNEINVVPAGQVLKFDININKSEKAYWDLSDFVVENSNSELENQERVMELLEDSVKLRMRTDVNFGSYLSGGVDSSLVTAIMARHSEQPVKSFTIGFSEVGFNEFEYARSVADQYGTEHNEILMNVDCYFSTMKELIGIKDAPLAVPNEVPLFEMSKELKKQITVVLSGEGADEIFGGYGRIFSSTLEYEHLNKGVYSKKFENAVMAKYGRIDFRSCFDHFNSIYSYASGEFLQKLFIDSELTRKSVDGFEEYFENSCSGLSTGTGYFEKLGYIFEKHHLKGLLARLDSSSMGASVEGRVPFVDHRLVEFAMSIPRNQKSKWISKNTISEVFDEGILSEGISEKYDVPKNILKKPAQKYLNDDILYRKKVGFPVPLDKWLDGDLYQLTKRELGRSGGLINDLLSPDWFVSLNEKTTKNRGMMMWMLLNLDIFTRKYL